MLNSTDISKKNSSRWKKCKTFKFSKKKLQKSQNFGHFFVASDVIKKLYLRAEFRIKLKKNILSRMILRQ